MPFWFYFRAFLVPFWCLFGAFLVPLQGLFGAFSGPFRDLFGAFSVPFCCLFGAFSVPFRCHFNALKSHCNRTLTKRCKSVACFSQLLISILREKHGKTLTFSAGKSVLFDSKQIWHLLCDKSVPISSFFVCFWTKISQYFQCFRSHSWQQKGNKKASKRHQKSTKFKKRFQRRIEKNSRDFNAVRLMEKYRISAYKIIRTRILFF